MTVLTVPTPSLADYTPRRDGGLYEFVDHTIVEKPVGKRSSFLATELLGFLRDFIRHRQLGRLYGPDLAYRCFDDDPDRIRLADVSYISAAKESLDDFDDEGYCTLVPDLVAEVISPNDLAYDVNRKIDHWLNAGVAVVLVVDPETQTVLKHARDQVQKIRMTETLTVPEVLPGFELPLAKLFEFAPMT
jgi:Uma2 family endonuclease